MNKNKLEKLISQHDFSFDLKRFSENDIVIDLALKTGEHEADIENLEEQHEELETKVERVENSQQWNDQMIGGLSERIYQLEQKIDEMQVKEEQEEINEPEIHEDKTEIEGEEEMEEERIEAEKSATNWGTIIGTVIFGTVAVFLVKLYENRSGGDKE